MTDPAEMERAVEVAAPEEPPGSEGGVSRDGPDERREVSDARKGPAALPHDRSAAVDCLGLLERLAPVGDTSWTQRLAYQLGSMAAQCRDFVVLGESARAAGLPSERIVTLYLLLRQAGLDLGTQLGRTLEPLETLIQQCENQLRAGRPKRAHPASDPLKDLLDEREPVESALRQQFRGLKLSQDVILNLSARLAEVDRLCRVLDGRVQQLLRPPTEPPTQERDTILTRLLELQLLLDVELRRHLLEEHEAGRVPCFEMGLQPWLSHFLSELAGQKVGGE